jgi:hypothetical protein
MHRQTAAKIPVSILLIPVIACSGSEVSQATPNFEKTIDVAVRATVEAKPGVYWLLHSNVESIIWRTDIYANFYLDRFETATQATVELLSVSFQDGTVWKDGQLFPAQ